eukprot:619788-Amphidinium_carterae.2
MSKHCGGHCCLLYGYLQMLQLGFVSYTKKKFCRTRRLSKKGLRLCHVQLQYLLRTHPSKVVQTIRRLLNKRQQQDSYTIKNESDKTLIMYHAKGVE